MTLEVYQLKKILAFLTAFVMCFAMLGTVPANALSDDAPVAKVQAKKWIPTTVYHTSPDDGFDDPWSVYCSTGRVHQLYEGQYSKYKGECADVDFISVTAGNKVVCDNQAVGHERRTYFPGVHSLPNFLDLRCVHQKI